MSDNTQFTSHVLKNGYDCKVTHRNKTKTKCNVSDDTIIEKLMGNNFVN